MTRRNTLTIGPREGSSAGMLPRRGFQMVFITSGRPVGFSFDVRPDRTVSYDGEEVCIRAP